MRKQTSSLLKQQTRIGIKLVYPPTVELTNKPLVVSDRIGSEHGQPEFVLSLDRLWQAPSLQPSLPNSAVTCR